MAKEFHLNSLVNRYGYNKKNKVGNVIELISAAMPFKLQDWENFYFKNGRSKEEIDSLGENMFSKIKDVLIPELLSITEEDCKEYLKKLIIEKTFDGRKKRFLIFQNILTQTTNKIFEFLPEHPNDWRYRTHRIDYYHKNESKDLLIGIKVCPVTMKNSQNTIVIETLNDIRREHKVWQEKAAGHFYIIFYKGSQNNLQIENKEILNEIREL